MTYDDHIDCDAEVEALQQQIAVLQGEVDKVMNEVYMRRKETKGLRAKLRWHTINKGELPEKRGYIELFNVKNMNSDVVHFRKNDEMAARLTFYTHWREIDLPAKESDPNGD